MSSTPTQLLIATGNAGKLAEFRRMFSADIIDVVGLDEFENITEINETGSTFAENARLKAIGYARQTKMLALADDSGLEIHALDRRPGVQSARYLGNISFAARMESLLLELAENKFDRSARFVCSIAIATPDGTIVDQVDGICDGIIAPEPCGSNGFGYDPIFIPDGYERTFGELSDAVKNEISHRSVALSKIIPKIRGFIAY